MMIKRRCYRYHKTKELTKDDDDDDEEETGNRTPNKGQDTAHRKANKRNQEI